MEAGLPSGGGADGASNAEPLAWDQVLLVAVVVLLIAVTVVGNTLIIVAVLTTRRLRTVTNCFVTSLAVADWLVGLCVMPLAVDYHFRGAWYLGTTVCDIWISLDVGLCTASILSLCAISVDRYLAVTQPLVYSRRRRSKRLAFGMILVVWILAAAITCPPIFGWYEPGQRRGNKCKYNQNAGYVVFSAMGSFYLPLMVMLYVYARISCVVARRHSHLTGGSDPASQRPVKSPQDESEIERGSSDDEQGALDRQCSSIMASMGPYGAGGAPPTGGHLHQDSLRSHYGLQMGTGPTTTNTRASYYSASGGGRVSSLRRESKTAKTLSIVVGGFVACWLPFFVTYILQPFCNVPDKLMVSLTWLGWINSAINPFIYSFYSPDFRIAFWRLTLRHCRCTRPPVDPSASSQH